MIQRAVEDRRIKKHKIDKEQRKNLRREEDRKNVLTYYSALFISFFIIISFFSVSLLQK